MYETQGNLRAIETPRVLRSYNSYGMSHGMSSDSDSKVNEIGVVYSNPEM